MGDKKSVNWIAEKCKIRAVRYYLAITDPEFLSIHDYFKNIRSFRTKAAQEVFENPFAYQTAHIYVLSKIAAWADVLLKFNWWLYATPEGLPELQKALKKEEFKPIGPGDIDPLYYDICLNQIRIPFFEAKKNNINNTDEGA